LHAKLLELLRERVLVVSHASSATALPGITHDVHDDLRSCFLIDFFFFFNKAKSERFFFFPLLCFVIWERRFRKKREKGGRSNSRRDFFRSQKKIDQNRVTRKNTPSGK